MLRLHNNINSTTELYSQKFPCCYDIVDDPREFAFQQKKQGVLTKYIFYPIKIYLKYILLLVVSEALLHSWKNAQTLQTHLFYFVFFAVPIFGLRIFRCPSIGESVSECFRLSYLGHIVCMPLAYLGHILVISKAYLGHVFGIPWTCLGHIFDISWVYLWHILGIS